MLLLHHLSLNMTVMVKIVIGGQGVCNCVEKPAERLLSR